MKDLMVDIEDGLKHELPDSITVEHNLRLLGIDNHSKIVICHANDNSLTMATRLFFTLDYAGLGDHSAILNGGLTAWKSEKRSLTQKKSEIKEGDFSIKLNTHILASRDWIYANLNNKNIKVVDARPFKIYSGSAKDHNASRRGHIPGAENIPFNEVSQEGSSSYLKKLNEIKNLFTENHISPGSTVVTYCGSGIWASPVYFAARLLGYEVRFYDGSYQEWANDDSLPVTDPNIN